MRSPVQKGAEIVNLCESSARPWRSCECADPRVPKDFQPLPAGFRRRAVIAAIARCSPDILVRDLSLRYVTCPGRRVRDPGPEAQSFVTSPLSPLYDLVMVYVVVSGSSTTRTSRDVEVDCMPDRHRSAWRRCRLKDQVDRGLSGAFQGGGRPLPLAA